MRLLYFSYRITSSFLLEAVILEHMVKSAVIFSDESEGKKEERNFHSPKREAVNLSRDEYRQVIKDAYQEGREDALKEKKEKKKQTSPQIEDAARGKIEEEGAEEAIKEHAKEEETHRQRFKTITQRQDIEMLRVKTVFPFTFFPDTLVIDTTKVTLAKKQLFATEYVTTIPLKDLSDVTIQTYLFMGTLMIRYMPQSNTPGMNEPVNVRIPNLKREDAIKAKNILKGALVAKAEEIDIAKLPPKEIEEVLRKFGESEGVV